MRNGSPVGDLQAGSLERRAGDRSARPGQDLARTQALFRRPAAHVNGRLPSPFDGQIRPGPRQGPAQDEPVPFPERKARRELNRELGCIRSDDFGLQGAPARARAVGHSAWYWPPTSVNSSTAQSGGLPSRALARSAEPRSNAPPVRHAPFAVARPAAVLDGRVEAGIDDDQGHQVGSFTKLRIAIPCSRQNAAHQLGVGDGPRIVTMDTERRDSPLVHQPQYLGFDFDRVVEDRIRFTPGHERAVIAVPPIGEALGNVGPPLVARLGFQQRARQTRARGDDGARPQRQPPWRRPSRAALDCTGPRAA